MQHPAFNTQAPRVSVLMPIFNQAAFVGRALGSLLAQSLPDWELLIIDDGSTDELAAALAPFIADPRLRLLRLEHNSGLGAALNTGLAAAQGDYIAYLPADDHYYPTHLHSLVACLDAQPDAVLAYAGVRYHYNRYAQEQVPNEPLQLVQVLHRRTTQRWLERSQLVSDDLERLFWQRLRADGLFVATRAISCEWVDHPQQHHKLVREPLGGINPYRAHYGARGPLRFHSSVGNHIDEHRLYARYRERPAPRPSPDGLKILLVGELAYNADRVLALEERGHKLYGLWTPEPYSFNTIGPLPFGNVTDLPRHGWRDAVRALKPDVIYALLNWQAVPFAHQVLCENPGVPFVWHFKEGPFICLQKGLWPQLHDLYARADGQIYSSDAMRAWFDTVVPGLSERAPTLVLDGDLPKRDWFDAEPAPRLSQSDGAIHTVVAGRPIGMHPWVVEALAHHAIHLHFYGDFTQGQWRDWIATVRPLAGEYLHLHPTVDQDRWVVEFSQYDAGWLHLFESRNNGELRAATWDDLNIPARLATMVAAGLPLLQRDNSGAVVATQALVAQHDIGVCFHDFDQLHAQLGDQARMQQLRQNVWAVRHQFTFDAHADRLVAFFRQIIALWNA
jgi:hypothetical protein